MSEIISKLGFDASGAIQSLNQLDGTLQKLESRLGQSAGAFSAFNKQGGQITKVGSAFKSEVPAMVAQTERLTVSLGLLSRVVFTQAIVRGLSQMRRGFESVAKTAGDFQRQVALIQTIDDSGQSFEKLSAAIQETSDSLNVPLLDTAAALYQTISNQVGDAAESQEFLNQSLRFAKATNSDAASSVDLLSGVLKSFNLNVSETDRVASIMFKTIDLGRIEANELANSFGRLGSIGKDTGVSLEELAGALSAISVRGSGTSESITQVRAIITALLKPSEAMGATLEKLGFASGEAAIKSLGFAGTLDKLRQSTGGSTSAMAALFPNVRGLSGAASLTSDNLVSLTNNIREMTTVSRDFADQKFLVATSTDAETAQKAINELSNAFTVNLGNALLGITANLTRATGGIGNINELVKAATPLILGSAAAVALLATKFTTGALAGIKFASSLNAVLNGLAAAPLAAGAGSALGSFIDDKLRDFRDAEINALSDANKQEIEGFKAKEEEKLKITRDAALERIRVAENFAQSLAGASSAEISQALNANQGVTALESALGRQIESANEYVAALKAAEQTAFSFQRTIAQGDVAGQQGKALRGEIVTLFNELQQRIDEGAERVVEGSASEAINSKIQGLLDKLKSLGNDGQLTAENLREAAIQGEHIQGLVSNANDILNNAGRAFNPALQDAEQIVLRFQQLLQLPPPQVVDTVALSALEQVLAQQPGAQFGSMASSLQAGVPASAAIAANMERAAAAAARVGGATVNQAFGGSIHLAAGGAARGIDTIPAMLSPGEFVMNARSSRKFYSQLQAMNAGQTPSFRQDGGTVNDNSTTVGDVHLHSNPANVRELMKDVRREVRRGTGRLD